MSTNVLVRRKILRPNDIWIYALKGCVLENIPKRIPPNKSNDSVDACWMTRQCAEDIMTRKPCNSCIL